MPDIASPLPPPISMQVDFIGSRGALFGLALKTGLWTILTLGFYRFWMKTRLRRWYWSSIRPGGHPLEYVGDPWEKLLGFFIAVVILTFYIGIVNLILMFVSFSVFNSSFLGYSASFLGVIPIWFYAQYRARRYVLGRTRWRGVRFALEKGAWGYAWRALVHWLLTIVTLGMLWPRMTFFLEKYKTDRTYFGSAQLHQGGRWWMLYKATIPFATALVLTITAVLWVFVVDPVFPRGVADPVDAILKNLDQFFNDNGMLLHDWNNPARIWVFLPLSFGVVYGTFHYRFVSKRILANHKTAEGLAMRSDLRGPRIVGIYVLGTFLAYMVLVTGLSITIFAGFAMIGATFLTMDGGGGLLGDLPRWAGYAALAGMYLSVFLLWGVLHNVFVTYPLMRHMAITLRLTRTDGLGKISQRKRDEFAEAEGFAEALDLGAAI